MDTKRKPKSDPDLQFWQAAFLAAEWPILTTQDHRLDPKGAAHLCADFADAAVLELNQRFPK